MFEQWILSVANVHLYLKGKFEHWSWIIVYFNLGLKGCLNNEFRLVANFYLYLKKNIDFSVMTNFYLYLK